MHVLSRRQQQTPAGACLSEILIDALPPPVEQISHVSGMAFARDQLLLTRHPLHGWSLPGGRIQRGEKVEQAIRRDMHQGAATVRLLAQIGYVRYTMLTDRPPQYPYSFPTRHTLLLLAHVTQQHAFQPTAEAEDQALLEVDLLPQLTHAQDIRDHLPLIQLAHQAYKAKTASLFHGRKAPR